MQKIQKATLRIFLSCMVITAVLMLTFVWWPGLEGEGQGPAPIMRFVLTFFIVGLASFLTWLTTMIMEIRDRSGMNSH